MHSNLLNASTSAKREPSIAQNAPKPQIAAPVDPVAAKIRQRNRWRIEEALEDGEDFWRQKQQMGAKKFKQWVEKEEFNHAAISKFIKLYETFASFSLDRIEWVDLNTLFSLCQPRYRELLEKLRLLPKWTEAKIQELMKQVRSQKKAKKPQPQTEELGTGWKRLPGGGRALQLPLLHEDWLGVLIEKVRKIKNLTLTQLIKEMTLFFVECEQVYGISLRSLKDYRGEI
ncbi:MAG TPA: hypothetical protein DEV81_05810 [Cyanobacteria bacterium UBA11049]|nr:hypothetical protein [Cyanobacteria bacterium UBA11049]